MISGRRVRIVGAGLLGTSMALALRPHGVEVTLVDTSPTAAALAADMGAGTVARDDDAAPDVVVVAAPPDVAADVVCRELDRWPEATVTDVTSVKAAVVEGVRVVRPGSLARFVPGHPMAGRERSGAVAARSDLFEGRTWVLCPDEAEPARVAQAAELAALCRARVVQMSPWDHDLAVAAVSHLPQVAASVVASRLRDLPEPAVALSGQGVRDVTRIADSDPMLWTQILSGNASAVRPLVEAMIEELSDLAHALRDVESDSPAPAGAPGRAGPRAVLARTIAEGREGRARIPGKHGSPAQTYATVAVVIPDEPGSLGQVFTLVGDSGVSVEDIRIEHDSGVAAGLLELAVVPVHAATLQSVLSAAGWAAHVVPTG